MLLDTGFTHRCILGESPIWNAKDECIYFVDIKKPSINRFSTKSGTFESIDAPSEIGCIALNNNGLVAAMEYGLAFVDFEKSEYRFFSSIDSDYSGNRPNDGKCDKNGRLWLATMDKNEVLTTGRLWRLSSSSPPKIMDHNFIIGNGIDWSPDSKKMYFTDSMNRTIYVYDFDLTNGTIKNKKVFVKIPSLEGYPDGLTVDSLGFVWSAHWDGWRITRYAPNGIVDKVIPLPVPRPTSLTFGGIDLTRIYITSASYGLTLEELNHSPLSGTLFEYDAGVFGKACNHFMEYISCQ